MHRLFRVLLALGGLASLLAAGPVSAATAPASEAGGVAVLPLRARGLSPAEYRKVSAKLASSFRDLRGDVVVPDEIASRLFRDEKQKAALEDARRLSSEGLERSRALEHPAALDRYDKSLALYREHFGEYADPQGLAETFVRRGAERLTGGDGSGARTDFFAAVTYAPDVPPSLDDFPPPVIDAWEKARAERYRRPLPPEDAAELATLGATLGLGSVVSVRAEKGDRADDGIAVEIAVWPVAPRSGVPLRTSRATVAETMDPIGTAVREAGAPSRPVATPRPVETPRVEIARVDPIRPPRTDPVRPPIRRPPVLAGSRPLWKSPWVWGGAAVLILAAGGAAAASASQKPKDPGYRVIVTPGS